MPIPISNFAKGLLGLLGANTLGNNPKVLSDELVGQVDVTDLLGASLITIPFGIFNPVTGGQNIAPGAGDLTVPVNCVWKVFAVHCAITTAAGETVAAFAPLLNVRQATGSLNLYLAPPRAVAASSSEWNPASALAAPIVVPAGSRFGINAFGVVGAPVGSVTVLAQVLAG